jgi:MscS family membrane protein
MSLHTWLGTGLVVGGQLACWLCTRMALAQHAPTDGGTRMPGGKELASDGRAGGLHDLGLLDHLPSALLSTGPYGLPWWQWLLLPVAVVSAWMLGSLLGRVTSRILKLLTVKTSVQWDDAVVSRLSGPLSLWWALLLAYLTLPWLGLAEPAELFVVRFLKAGFLVGLFWVLSRSADIGGGILLRSPWATEHPASVSLIPLGTRVLKIAVLAIGMVTLLSQLGYPVASLLAGLGIGGLALALAAQKTVENLFGAFSIGADQPFREGDFVRIEDFVGTVEQIGLRSTRVRTLDRTIITIPNGKLADMRLETFSARDRIRLACTVGLVYQTSSAQMREVLEGFEAVLRSHPKIWPDAVVVRFKELAASSLDIEIMAWFQTPDWGEFQVIRQGVLLAFMEVVERAGTSFAYPTRTVHLAPPAPSLP